MTWFYFLKNCSTSAGNILCWLLSLKRVSESSWDSCQVQTLDLQKVSKKSEHTDRNIEFFVAIVLSTALKIITCCLRRARFQNLTLCIVLFQIPDNSLMALVPKETLHTSINEATSGNSTKCQPRAFYLIFYKTLIFNIWFLLLLCICFRTQFPLWSVVFWNTEVRFTWSDFTKSWNCYNTYFTN